MAPQQDAFMDDSDDCCPLCVEEFDLSDRSFRPCPCGYQVCQFCYNNIKTNMNGLCPACRRQYDDKNIQWKVISPEEAKADVAAQARKKAAARQKEAERRQVETLNRKHLAGLRVVQKNLVYVVGMNITGSDQDVLQTLRGPQHFGQYGDIIKVVVSKAKNENAAGQQPLGIYVTYVDKDDAATCISALDGQQHEGRTLRAQYGTTKYCSAYLRNEKCNNRQCMFLHETGEDSDSFSRQDLSSLNALSTQRKTDNSQHAQQHQAPPQQAPQNMAAASQLSMTSGVKSDAMSRSDSGEGSALPTTANWAKNPQIEQSRRSSQAASRATPSPKTTHAKPNIQRSESRAAQSTQTPAEGKGKGKEATSSPEPPVESTQTSTQKPATKPESLLRFERLIKQMSEFSFEWSLDRDIYDSDALSFIDNFPPLVDTNGGAVRLAIKVQQDLERAKNEEERTVQTIASLDDEENLTGGSLQLGGEPETETTSSSRRQAALPSGVLGFDGPGSAIGNEFAALALGGRSLTPQQQRNMALLKSAQAADAFTGQVPRGGGTILHQSQLSNPFQAQNQQINPLSRHGRHSSRFTFANDTGSASTAVKPSTNAQLLSQQSSMMPSTQQKAFGSQPPPQSSLYTNSYSNIQGPPPGLKSSGTPPISGGGMFGQGHGFASAMGGSLAYGGNLGMKGNNGNDDLVRDIVRGRMNGAGGSDNAKLDISDPSILQSRMHHGGVGQGAFGSAQNQDPFLDDIFPTAGQPGMTRTPSLYQNMLKDKASGSRSGTRPGTPVHPPGLMSMEFPPLSAPSQTLSKQDTALAESRTAEVKRGTKAVVPAVPQLPERAATPAKRSSTDEKIDGSASHERNATTLTELSKDPQVPLPHAHEVNTLPGRQPSKSEEKEAERCIGKQPNPKSTASDQRQRPGKLDIGAATRSIVKSSEPASSPLAVSKPSTPKKADSTANGPSTSQPQTPATAASQASASPAVRQARTLRLVSTTKTEPNVTASAKPTMPPSAPVRQASRQASVTSFNLPDTPVNEVNSDNVSLTSASASRPPSPHLGSRVGAAPVRQKTKSQAKKDRQARAREEERKLAEVQAPQVAEEPVQAPIVGRMKKAKKQKNEVPNKDVAASRPMSPTKSHADLAAADGEAESKTETSTKSVKSVASRTNSVHGMMEPSATQSATPTDVEIENSQKASLTAASLFNKLLETNAISMDHLESFLNVPGYNHHFDLNNFGMKEEKNFPSLTQQQQRTLDEGEPTIVKISAKEYGLVLPNRTVLRHLSLQEAKRYIELRQSVHSYTPDFFVKTRLHACANMDLPWDDASQYAAQTKMRAMMFADDTELTNMFAMSIARDHDDISREELWDDVPSSNARLATDILQLPLHEGELALKRSEEHVVGLARKEADALEKRLNQMVKKNRKLFREVSDLR